MHPPNLPRRAGPAGLALLLAGALAACAQPGAPGRGQDPAGSCRAEPARFAVGQEATETLVERARREAHARTARVIRPGQAVTMEYNPDRLNLRVNDANRVQTVQCG